MIPAHVREIMTVLSGHGHLVRAVGGCVRDLSLGITPGDWDLASSAAPEDVLEWLGGEATGLRYGVVTVRGVEVAAFRKEGRYTDHRRPDGVEFTDDLETDLRRRDFTINAMAMDVNGKITDPFGGLDDLKNKRVRAVGDPFRRFDEDALRILRALRFASVLDFEVEEKTREGLLASVHTLQFLTKTVTLREIEKLRAGAGAERIIKEYSPHIPDL